MQAENDTRLLHPPGVGHGRIRRVFAALIAPAVLAGVGLAAATPASADLVSYSGWLPELTDSRSLSVHPVASGVVRRVGGSAPAVGAAVHLEAWPSADMLASMQEGQSFDLTPIAKTVTASDGSYSLRIDPKVDLAPLTSQAGTVDVDLVAWTDNGTVSYSFSIVPTDVARTGDPFVAQADPITGDVSRTMLVDLEIEAPDAARLPVGSVVTAQDGAEIAVTAPAEMTPTDFSNGCPTSGTKLVQRLGDRWVNVGSIHTATSGKRMKYTYSGSAESTLGVGVSSSGAFGSFSASGTVVRSRSNTTTWPWYTTATSRHLDTLFSYGKYCTTTRSPGPSFRWSVRAIRHEGGTNHRNVSIPSTPSGYCVPYRSAGSGGEKSSTNAITWTNGAKLGGVIGIDLSSRTGYRTNSKIEYEFTTAGRLCGTHDKPNGTPRRLVMRAL